MEGMGQIGSHGDRSCGKPDRKVEMPFSSGTEWSPPVERGILPNIGIFDVPPQRESFLTVCEQCNQGARFTIANPNVDSKVI